jgi:hypothetical protein
LIFLHHQPMDDIFLDTQQLVSHAPSPYSRYVYRTYTPPYSSISTWLELRSSSRHQDTDNVIRAIRPSTNNPMNQSSDFTSSDQTAPPRAEDSTSGSNNTASKRRRVPGSVTRNACINCKKARAEVSQHIIRIHILPNGSKRSQVWGRDMLTLWPNMGR